MENCLECGELLEYGDSGYCGCCLFVKNDRGVQSCDASFSWDLAERELSIEIRKLEVEIEAVSQAMERAWCASSRDKLKWHLGTLKAELHDLLRL